MRPIDRDEKYRKEAECRVAPKPVKTTTRFVAPATAAGVLLRAVRQR
jgi:hypothetical protein